jgi:type I restriction enzyme R subunit
MTLLTEKRDVQDQLINHLIGIGWRYLPPGDVAAARGGDESQPFLPDVARRQLLVLNPGLVTSNNVDDVLRRLRGVQPSLAGNEAFLKALRGGWTVYDPAEKRERNLVLVDYDHPERNDFTFTQEFPFVDRDRRRLDMVLFVNGLPVVVVENKSPALPDAELEAFDQVQHLYAERIPEFLKAVQFFAACDRHVHYGPTWNDDLKAFYRWKAGGKDYGLERLSKTLFDPAGLLRILRDYLIFFRADDQTQKYILRSHQMRAAERIVQRVAEGVGAGLAPAPQAGLIWHTQGSGKTLTMIVAAHQVRRLPALENPTILVVVDRRELETQMVHNLEAFGFPMVERATSKKRLRALLASDYRGLIVTLIQKFDRIPKHLSQRRNIVVLVDEAHRSQEGDLAVYMRAALPNAFYFGFTGTPVDRGKVGRGTFETFGQADPGGYQDKYGIDESIDDKTTVPLYYTLAPSELRLDRATLEEEFFRVVEDAGVASFEELNRLLDRADKLKAVLKAPARVAAIAAHAARHFRANVEPLGFKAFLVAVDREACALYKQALDQHLPDAYSRVVYTPYHKDPELLRQYHLDDDAEKQVRKAFRDPARPPQILIVTEKLLTGYDAPVLYAMYLDKPLKDHTLLQAIARVNRPYPHKSSGLIVDYIGIFEDLQRALAFDRAAVSRALIDLAELKGQFAGLMDQVEAAIAPIDLAGDQRDRVARIIDHFFDAERREAFIQDFRALQTAYEIISPDPFLRDYLDRYALVAQVYRVVYDEFDPEAGQRKLRYDLLKKTDALIRENVDVEYLASPLPLYRINQDLAKVIAADGVSDQVKVINLYRSLIAHVQRNQDEQPYLVSIGEEVEAIIRRLHERQISAQTALQQIQAKAQEAVQAEAEQRSSRLPGKAFAFLWVLRGYGLADAEAKAQEIEAILDGCPGWPYNQRIEQTVRLALHRALRDDVPGAARRTEAVNNLLRMHRTVMG